MPGSNSNDVFLGSVGQDHFVDLSLVPLEGEVLEEAGSPAVVQEHQVKGGSLSEVEEALYFELEAASDLLGQLALQLHLVLHASPVAAVHFPLLQLQLLQLPSLLLRACVGVVAFDEVSLLVLKLLHQVHFPSVADQRLVDFDLHVVVLRQGLEPEQVEAEPHLVLPRLLLLRNEVPEHGPHTFIGPAFGLVRSEQFLGMS